MVSPVDKLLPPPPPRLPLTTLLGTDDDAPRPIPLEMAIPATLGNTISRQTSVPAGSGIPPAIRADSVL